MANLKTEVDKLDLDKLPTVPVDLSKLSNVVKNDVVKKTVCDKLVTKVDNIDTSGLVKKTDCNTKISEIEDKIPDSKIKFRFGWNKPIYLYLRCYENCLCRVTSL